MTLPAINFMGAQASAQASQPTLPLGRVMSAGGTLLGGFGGAMQSFGYAQYNAASAKAARLAADAVKKKAAFDVMTQRLAKRRLLSTSQFLFGYAGVQLTGTPVDVLQETARELAINEENTAREGRIQSEMYLEQAKQMEKAKKANQLAGALNIASGIGGMFAL